MRQVSEVATELSGPLTKCAVNTAFLDDALLIANHFPPGRWLALRIRDDLLDARERKDSAPSTNLHNLVVDSRLFAVIHGLTYLGHLSKQCDQSVRKVVATRVARKFPKKRPRTDIAIIQLAIAAVPDVLSAIYECSVFLLLSNTKDFVPEFRSDASIGGCDMQVAGANLLIECKDVQSSSPTWPPTFASLRSIRNRIRAAEDQLWTSRPHHDWKPAIFIDLPDVLFRGLFAESAGVTADFWEKIFAGSRLPVCTIFTNLDITKHYDIQPNTKIDIARLTVCVPTMTDIRFPNLTDARPEFMQSLLHQIGESLGGGWFNHPSISNRA